MSIETALQDLQRREELAENIVAILQKDARIVEIEYYGSLADGTADCYSDIDIRVQLCDVSDRAFAEILPDLIRSVGSLLVEGWGLGTLPGHYVRTFYFDDYPLFWHVDIACESDYHIDGSDLKNTYHWSQMFKIWIDVLSNLLRGRNTTEYIERFISRWTDISQAKDSPPKGKLSHYLDLCVQRARDRGAPCEAFYQRCDELRKEYLI